MLKKEPILKLKDIELEKLCSFLEWDSNFFSKNIASVKPNKINQSDLNKIFDWCEKNKIDCLYLLADPNCQITNYLAMKNYFSFVDIRLALMANDFKKNVYSDHSSTHFTREFVDSDISFIKKISRTSHTESRFYFDPKFPNNLCNKFYQTWIENSISDLAEVVLVAGKNNNIVGYISCSINDSKDTGKIGLLAVDEDVRGLKVGTELVNASLKWFLKNNVEVANVVTQGKNIASQKLYQKCGFKTYSVMIWYHKWFN